MSPRFALYAAPGSGGGDPHAAALLERAEAWLGRSAAGSPVAPLAPAGWTRGDVDDITVDAGRYGFHGTLKAPFRLADGRSAEELEAAAAAFAAARRPVTIPELALERIGRFFALVPGAPSAELRELADATVTGFDPFRAPPSAAETARRRPEELSPRRRELLERWGYPYVLDEFRFHLTLSDRIPAEGQDEVEEVLRAWFAEAIGRPLRLEALAVFVEPSPGAPFELRSTHPLSAPASAPADPTGADRTASNEGTR